MTDRQATRIARKMSKNFEWLSYCVQEFDVTEIGEQHSLKETIQQYRSKQLDKAVNKMKTQDKSAFKEQENDDLVSKMREKARQVAKNMKNDAKNKYDDLSR